MPEGFFNATEGSGKKLHTWQRTIGANDVHDEYMLLGDQPLASYVIDQSTSSIATAADHIMQVMAGASLNVYVRRIRIWQAAVATTAAAAAWEIVRLTTAGSGGTSNAVDPLDTTDAGAGATAQALPSAKGTEGVRLYRFTTGLVQTIPTGGFNTLLADLDFDKNPRLKPIRIPAGTSNGLAVKIVAANAGATVSIVTEITEQNY